MGPLEPTRTRAGVRRVPATALTWALAAVNVGVWAAMELAGGSTNPFTLVAFGAKFNPFVAQGEYWRLVTATFLHVGVTHLALNTAALLSFGRLAEMAFGHSRFAAIYLVSGISGACFSYIASPSLSAGASGALFGEAAALATFSARSWRHGGTAARSQLGGFAFLLAVNLALGLVQPGIDNWGHVGGLLAGWAAASFLAPRPVPFTDPESGTASTQWESSPPASWLSVPAILAVLAVAVVVASNR